MGLYSIGIYRGYSPFSPTKNQESKQTSRILEGFAPGRRSGRRVHLTSSVVRQRAVAEIPGLGFRV